MTFATDLESKFHAAITEARDEIAALIKQFRSAAAVTDEQLQQVHDNLHGALGEPDAPAIPSAAPQAPAATVDTLEPSIDAAVSAEAAHDGATEQPAA